MVAGAVALPATMMPAESPRNTLTAREATIDISVDGRLISLYIIRQYEAAP